MILSTHKAMNQNLIPLKVKRLEPDAKLPVYGSAGAACFDLHAYLSPNEPAFTLDPFSVCEVHTALSFEVPPGYSMDIRSRSGNFRKAGVLVFPGTIDSDYRGEVLLMLTNTSATPFTIKNGDRIAQAMLNKVPQLLIVEVTELTETVRGAGGFGSTGT